MEQRGPYQLIETLSEPEQDLVAKACLVDGDSDEVFVLKAISEDAHPNLKDSLQLLGSTRSPHLRVPHEVFEDEGETLTVARWLPGPSLEDARQKRFGGRVPVRQALLWLKQLLEGLEVLHYHGLLHGDVKPSNLLLDNEDHAVLVDLDAMQPTGESKLRAATPEYLTPIEEHQSTAERDLFAAAMTFGALLTGSLPKFSRDAPWKASAIDPLLPKALDQIFLGVQTEESFSSTREMTEAVDELLGTDSNTSTDQPTSPPTRRVAVPKQKRRPQYLLWVLALLCLPLGYGAGSFLKKPPVGPPPTIIERTGIDIREGVHNGKTIWQTVVLGRPVAAFAGPDDASGGETAKARAHWVASVLQQAHFDNISLDFEYRRELPRHSEVWLKADPEPIYLMRITKHEQDLFDTTCPELARRWTQVSRDTLTLLGQKVAPGRPEGVLLLRPWKTRAETMAAGKNLKRWERVQILVEAFHSLKPDLQEDILSTYLPPESEEKEKESE